MATRIRYRKVNGLYVGPEFRILDKAYTPRYNLVTYIAEIVIENGTVGGYFTFISVIDAKRRLKRELKKLGVKFSSEVRRKKSQQQAIKQALEGKQE
tara:strand:- start:302 stop:592 length:291 start_codon:yes stop_codon:yes gene_type:complete